MRQFPVPTKRTLTTAWAVVGLVFFALGVWGVATLAHQSHEIDGLHSSEVSARADREDLRSDQAKMQAALDQANAKLVDAGKTPVLPPQISAQQPPPVNLRYVPIPGPPGPVGPKGESITGPKGDTVVGPPGESITGAPGKDGKDGADSTVPGPGPTDAQIAQAVADYCAAHNDCKGDPAPLVPTP